MNVDEEKLLMNKPIYISNAGYVYHPTVDEITAIGSENYFQLMIPYLINKEEVNCDSVLDIFFNDLSSLDFIASSLKIFFKQEINIDVVNKRFYIGEFGVIDFNNFDELQSVIRSINCVKDSKPEKLPKMSDEQRRIHEKMKYHRERKAKENIPSFKEIINTVVHCGRSVIPYDVVGKFTYYQLINTYQIILGLDNYNTFMMYELSPKFEVKDKTEHWTKIIKQI